MPVKTYHAINEGKSLLHRPQQKQICALCSSEQWLSTSMEAANLSFVQLLVNTFISDLIIQVKPLHFINFVLVLALMLI